MYMRARALSLTHTSWPMASLILAGGLRTANSPTDQHALLHTERNSGSKLPCTACSTGCRWGCKCVTADLARSPSSANPLCRTSGIGCVRHLGIFIHIHTYINTRIHTYIYNNTLKRNFDLHIYLRVLNSDFLKEMIYIVTYRTIYIG